MRKVISQKLIILIHLQKGKSISQREAIINYNIIRLSAIIYNLRNEGLDIKTILKPGFYGGVYAEYKLNNVNELF